MLGTLLSNSILSVLKGLNALQVDSSSLTPQGLRYLEIVHQEQTSCLPSSSREWVLGFSKLQ